MTVYTIKQIAEKIGYSVPTTTRKLNQLEKNNKIDVKPIFIKMNGKKTKAYNLSDDIIDKLKSSDSAQKDFSINSNNYFNEYISAYKELIELKSEQKLLTDKLKDKDGLYLEEIRLLKEEKERIVNDNKHNIRIIYIICIVSYIVFMMIIFALLFFNKG